MSQFAAVTDADLEQARQDPQFRHNLVADNLEHLLAALNRLRAAADSSDPDPDRNRLIREGVDLAVKLAEILHKIAEAHFGGPQKGKAA